MRRVGASLLLMVLAACAPKAVAPPANETEDRMPCDEAGEVRVGPRVDGERVLVEAVLTRYRCSGGNTTEAPVRLAEIRLRPDLPACPVGQLGARSWPGGFSTEPALAAFFTAPRARERDALQTGLTTFSNDAQAYVIGCPEGRRAEWLFVEAPKVGLPQRVAFFDGDAVRFAPGHENVVFPAPPPPPVTPPEPPLPEASEVDEPPEPEPPRVTATGCPAERLDAQWLVRRYGSHEQPAPERRLPGPVTVERWALRLDGKTATLVYEEQRRPTHGDGADTWTCSEATTVQGTFTRRGAKLTLTFGGLVATCRETTLAVPPANAKRDPKRLPQREDEEGCDRYRWATKARVTTKALVCTGALPLNALAVFGPPPGLERLVLGNDCRDPSDRDALRLVPADGSFAPAL